MDTSELKCLYSTDSIIKQVERLQSVLLLLRQDECILVREICVPEGSNHGGTVERPTPIQQSVERLMLKRHEEARQEAIDTICDLLGYFRLSEGDMPVGVLAPE